MARRKRARSESPTRNHNSSIISVNTATDTSHTEENTEQSSFNRDNVENIPRRAYKRSRTTKHKTTAAVQTKKRQETGSTSPPETLRILPSNAQETSQAKCVVSVASIHNDSSRQRPMTSPDIITHSDKINDQCAGKKRSVSCLPNPNSMHINLNSYSKVYSGALEAATMTKGSSSNQPSLQNGSTSNTTSNVDENARTSETNAMNAHSLTSITGNSTTNFILRNSTKKRRSNFISFRILFLSILVTSMASMAALSVIYVLLHNHSMEIGHLNDTAEERQNVERGKLREALRLSEQTKLSLNHAHTIINKTKHKHMKCALQIQHDKHNIEDLERNKKFLSEELDELRQRLVSLQGSEEDQRQALDAAWERIDQLGNERYNYSTKLFSIQREMESLKQKRSALTEDLETSMGRILELELDHVALSDQVDSLQYKIQSLELEKQQMGQLVQNKEDEIDDLNEKLFNVDGDIWAFQLQIEYLEELYEENQLTIQDLKYWNHKMKSEILDLKFSMTKQYEEGVMALNAVATSAAKRKAEQFQQFALEMDTRMEFLLNEAVSAANSVASAAQAHQRLSSGRRSSEICDGDNTSSSTTNTLNDDRDKEDEVLQAARNINQVISNRVQGRGKQTT